MNSGGRVALAACVALVVASLTFRLGGYPLLDPDEGRNAEVAREMAASNDYLLPRLDGLPYADKPALFFATAALAMKVLGPTELAARLPSLLFTLTTLGLVGWLGRRMFGEEAAWIAVIATAASPLTLAFARTVIFDSTVTFFVVAAVVAFWEAGEGGWADGRMGGWDRGGTVPSDHPATPPSAQWYAALAWASIALGVLTKGPIALALPLMIATPYLAWRKAWRILVDPLGLLLFLAIVLPWVRYMSAHVPGYLRYVFFTETFQRLTTQELQRTGPWWYFVPILVLGALPWSVMALARLGRVGARADRRIVFLLLWIVVPLVFFSLSQSKRPQYVLPMVPAIGLLVAGTWSDRAARLGGVTIGLSGLAILLLQAPLLARIHGVTAHVAAAVPGVGIPLGMVSLAAGASAIAWSSNRPIALLALALPTATISFISGTLMNEIGRDRSERELARSIEPAMPQETEVVGVRAYPLSLAFYLHRTVTLSTDSASELTSNYIVRHFGIWRSAPDSPLRSGDWWRDVVVACPRPTVFVIRSSDRDARDFLARRVALLGDTGRYAAFGPCGMSGLASSLLSPPRRQRGERDSRELATSPQVVPSPSPDRERGQG